MADITKKYPSLADVYRDLTLFFKKDSNTPYSLADFTSIAEGRWEYFRNNWDFIKESYYRKINLMPEGSVKVNAKSQYITFGELIDNNRASSQNPLSSRDNLRKFKDLLDIILINDLDISQVEQSMINEELRRISNLQKDDYYEMRERVRITHDKAADSMGLGDETYNTMYERVGVPQILTFTFDNYPIFSSLIDLMNQITMLIPTTLVQNERPDPFSVVRQAINNPDIFIGSATTGYLVPFPVGATLEKMAQKYLGNPDMWIDIATANGLRFPYVDEVGRKVYLLINGIANIAIVDIEESPNFYVNQEIFIGSNGKTLTKRKIINITEDKNNSQLLITVNGASNLANYTTVQGAYVYSYMPYTVNSNNFIMIPTQGDIGFPINAQETWFVKELPNDVKNMGVDLAISADSDLVFNNTGDLSLVYGIANAAQALNLKVQTKAKDLIRDPAFGIVEIAGKYNNSEITNVLLSMLIDNAISGDDRFDGIDGLGYTITNNSIFISVNVRLKGSSGTIPLTFQLPKG